MIRTPSTPASDALTAPTASPVHSGLINRQAWSLRWQDRARSIELAREVLAQRVNPDSPGPSVALACRTLA